MNKRICFLTVCPAACTLLTIQRPTAVPWSAESPKNIQFLASLLRIDSTDLSLPSPPASISTVILKVKGSLRIFREFF